MSATFRFARLALFAALVSAGLLSTAHARNCEDALQNRYRCTGTYSGGGSSDFCIRTERGAPDGTFTIVEQESLLFHCTCEAKGKAPNVQFAAASGDFFCGGYETILVGKASGAKISGQGFNTSPASGIRSSFTCQAVTTCP